MAYKKIKNKTYSNVLYIGKLIQEKKGYPYSEALQVALNQFSEFDGSYNWVNIETMLHSLVTYEDHLQRVKMHEFNMLGSY